MNSYSFFRAGLPRFGWFILIAGLLTGGCATEPSAITGESRSYGYSWQQELQLGAEADQQIVAEMGLYPDDELQAYVEEVAQRVLARSDFRDPNTPEIYRNTEFTFRVIDSPVVNAFALPGGYVYVTRGLLTHLNNEAQLAVVLGHEIAHVTARHASRQALRTQFSQIGLVAGAIIGQEVFKDVPDLGSTILDLGGTALQLVMFRYSRDAERESDSLGVRYAGTAGYAASEGAEFFRSLQRLSGDSGKALPSWASTHPDPGERAETVARLGAEAAATNNATPEVGRERLIDHLDGLVLGDDPRQGFRRQDHFYHPELRFQFSVPAGWTLQNERDKVLVGAPNGSALITLGLVGTPSAREAAAAFLQQSGAQVSQAGETRINGLRAHRLTGHMAQGQTVLGFTLLFIEHDGRVYRFAGLAPQATFGQWLPAITSTLNAFAPLSDPALLDVKPLRIALVTTDREAPFRDLLPRELPEPITPESLAILNQISLDERIPAGRTLKLPR